LAVRVATRICIATRPRAAVDLRESRIEWTGRNLLNSHHGVIGLKEGSLEYEHGRLTGGKFVIDMNAIYGSGKFFRNLGMHLVNDMIEIRLRVVTA
jgi:hypothetical protein